MLHFSGLLALNGRHDPHAYASHPEVHEMSICPATFPSPRGPSDLFNLESNLGGKTSPACHRLSRNGYTRAD